MAVAESKERFTVTLPASLKSELEKAVPKRQRSRFTAKALKSALAEQARQALIEAIENAPDYPSQADSTETIRDMRQVRANR